MCSQQMFKMLSICTHARLSHFLHLLTAVSITFCCRLFQTSTRRSFSSLTLFIWHSYTICCTKPQTLFSAGFRSGLFGGQRSRQIKSGVSCCSCLMVSLHDEMECCLVERQTYCLQHAWSLAASAERVRHRGNTSHWFTFQVDTDQLRHTHFRHSIGNHNGFGESWLHAQQTSGCNESAMNLIPDLFELELAW